MHHPLLLLKQLPNPGVAQPLLHHLGVLLPQLNLLLLQRFQQLTLQNRSGILISKPIIKFLLIIFDQIERTHNIVNNFFDHNPIHSCFLLQQIHHNLKSFSQITLVMLDILIVLLLLILFTKLLLSSMPNIPKRTISRIIK